jgi:DNA-directed RNA polymerase specialized sigma24 family protein
MVNIYALDEWPTAATHLYEQYAVPLAEHLSRRFPESWRQDPSLIYDAVLSAVLDIALKLDELDSPEDLHGLLYVTAARKLLAVLRGEGSRRCREKETGAEFVARRQDTAREEWEGLADIELLERILNTIPENDEEVLVLRHWGADFQEIADALGWKEIGRSEQRRRVKVVRDRLAKRLKRFLEDTAE